MRPLHEILTIENLSFSYDGKTNIYDNFSLHVKKGEVVCIVGPSGSGKSTLFELISKNLKPNKGNIKAGKISQIFQDPYNSFHPTYSIIDQIKDVVSIQGYEVLCKELSLETQLLEEKPHLLSGGQLQRCSILRSILMKPDLILADEPTSALDNITQIEVMKLLIKFLDRTSILLITHDESLASWCADKIISLEKLK